VASVQAWTLPGHIAIVRALIAASADTSAVAYGNSIFCCAARYGYIDVIRELLAAGADATHVNRNGRTARQELTVCHPHLAWPAL
jgi:ankyrin repeat protein